MTAVWQTIPMGQLCSISSGKSDTQDAVANGSYAFFDRSRVVKRSSRYLYNCEALIIPGEGTEFLPKHFIGKFDLHQRAYALFNFSNQIDVKFLYYYLHHLRDYFPSVAVGATVKSLRLRHFEQLPVALVELHQQRRIVGILDEAFEGIALAKVNAEKNLQNARALFESGVEDIFSRGQSWAKTQLGELCVIGDGNHSSNYPTKEELVEKGVPFIRATNLIDGAISGLGMRFLSPEKHAKLRKGHLKSGDLLFTNRGEIGKVAIVDQSYDGANLNSQIAWLRCLGNLQNRFLFFALSSRKTQDYLRASQNGAALQQFTIRQLKTLMVPLPSTEEQSTVVEFCDALLQQVQHLAAVSKQKLIVLESLKQSLLHQAFTGQL